MGNSLTRPPDNFGSPRRTYQFDPAGWRRTALASTVLTDAAKVLVAVLADCVKVNGTISVPRADLADRCGCSDRQISERLKQLVEARFLDRVSAGKRGHTAVYRALRPTESARQDRPLSSSGKRAVSPDAFAGTDTAEPRAFSESVEREEPGKRAAQPRTSTTQRQVPACRSTSELPSSSMEKRSAEVDRPVTWPFGQKQRREEAEPASLGVVIDGLFGRRAS